MRTFVALGIALTAGCSVEPKPQRVGAVMAAYSFRTLTADLGQDIRVPAVVTAAERALRDRGYTISSRRTTEDSGKVVGNAPGSRMGGSLTRPLTEQVVVSAILTAAGTRVKVTAEPRGDEAISRAILDDVLLWLGL